MIEQPLPVTALIHGAYYRGECRNASVARWDADTQLFYHWRTKFGRRFVESIPCHGQANWKYDWFLAFEELINPQEVIPV